MTLLDETLLAHTASVPPTLVELHVQLQIRFSIERFLADVTFNLVLLCMTFLMHFVSTPRSELVLANGTADGLLFIDILVHSQVAFR